MEVAICVITYRRPEGLKRLLESLNALTFQAQAPDLRVVVVENDETGLAQRVCNDVRSTLRWALEYHVEPRRGIPFARNKAVAVAQRTADFIAFIDDDEVPDVNWLDELLRVMKEYHADVVTGPVVPYFMEEPPAWVIKGKFYDRQRHATGTSVDRAFTGNILFRREIFEKMDEHFDERLALTGGEDAHFLRRVHLAGYKIVWADQAIAHERLPASRVNAKWILRRAFRIGITTTFIARDLRSALPAALSTIPVGLYRIGKGLFFLPLTCLLGRRFVVTYTRHICYGAGILAGWANVRYEQYR